jgi:hypothetical protein
MRSSAQLNPSETPASAGVTEEFLFQIWKFIVDLCFQIGYIQDQGRNTMKTAATAVEEIARGMTDATRRRNVGQICLQAALNRLSDEIDELCDVHAPAIANAGIAAELRKLKEAALDSLAALKGGAS